MYITQKDLRSSSRGNTSSRKGTSNKNSRIELKLQQQLLEMSTAQSKPTETR